MDCSTHGTPKVQRRRTDGRSRNVCLRCDAERLQRHRSKGRAPEDPVKKAARKAIENAIRSGDLVRQPCERCGKPDAQAHHEDYTKPLDVLWLCPKHHKARHKEMAATEAAA